MHLHCAYHVSYGAAFHCHMISHMIGHSYSHNIVLTSQVASQEFIQEAANGNLSKVKAILETGAVYVDVVDGKGNSALFAAAVSK